MKILPSLLVLLALLSHAAPCYCEDWPQWLGSQRDGVWRENGLLESLPPSGLPILWKAKCGGGYAGPAVAGGKVFLPYRILDPGAADPSNPFQKTKSTGKECIECFDENTGKTLWEFQYPCKYEISYPTGPRATPLVDGDRVLSLGAMGDLHCLKVNDGKPLWSLNLPKTYPAPIPIWGFAAHPLKYKDTYILLAGGKGSVVVALHRETGKEVWRSLELENPGNEIGYCPPMLFLFDGKEQLIIWHPEAINGLDPSTGALLWRIPFKLKANLSIPTPRQVGNQLFITAFYNGSMLLEVQSLPKPSAKILWKGQGRGEMPQQTRDLHSIMCNPWVTPDHIYGVCSYGELRGLETKTGKRLWMDLRATSSLQQPQTEPTERWANAFIIHVGEKFLLFNEKGELIQAELSPQGYRELGRTKLLEPTGNAGQGNRKVVWSHPALANRSIFVRNDRELIKFDFSQKSK